MIKINTELKIEIGPVSESRMSYDEAILYCFSLNIDGKIGWRMPTKSEYMQTHALGWHVENDSRNWNGCYKVTPVRDITYD